MKTGWETEIRQFDVTVFVNQDIIWLNISVDETEFVNSFDSKNAFCHIKAADIFAECVVFDEHCHEISSGQKFH